MKEYKVLFEVINKFSVQAQVKALILGELTTDDYEFTFNEDMEAHILEVAYNTWVDSKVDYTTAIGIGVAMNEFLISIGWDLDAITKENFYDFYLSQEWR